MLSLNSYHIAEMPDGLHIEREDGPPIEITLGEFALEVRALGDFGSVVRERFGLCHFAKMLDFVARGLLRRWQPADGWFGLEQWSQEHTTRSLARQLREHWLRLLRRANPTVLAVQRAVYSATFGDAPLCAEPQLYQRKYLVQDVLRYPAAAVALRNAQELYREHSLTRLHRSPSAEGLRQLAQELGLTLLVSAMPEKEPGREALLDRLEDWRSLFSDTGTTYRSLNRTLMNLPNRVPHRLLCRLRLVHLDRPMTGRLVLIALGIYAGIRKEREGTPGRADHTAVFLQATEDHVRSALQTVANHLQQRLLPQKVADLRQFVYFLADYPQESKGTLSQLAEKAVRWHRLVQEEQTSSLKRKLGVETPTVAPPVALPEEPGVTFLATVGDVCTEAERMGHCVASYVDLAVTGSSYLFHVNHQGEEATVEVGVEGKVRQSQGPKNTRNTAASFGMKVLGDWATQLPQFSRSEYTQIEEEVPF